MTSSNGTKLRFVLGTDLAEKSPSPLGEMLDMLGSRGVLFFVRSSSKRFSKSLKYMTGFAVGLLFSFFSASLIYKISRAVKPPFLSSLPFLLPFLPPFFFFLDLLVENESLTNMFSISSPLPAVVIPAIGRAGTTGSNLATDIGLIFSAWLPSPFEFSVLHGATWSPERVTVALFTLTSIPLAAAASLRALTGELGSYGDFGPFTIPSKSSLSGSLVLSVIGLTVG